MVRHGHTKVVVFCSLSLQVLRRYEQVLQNAMQEETTQTEISDPALSNAVALDHKRSATAAVRELSDTWSTRNSFETEPFA
jgi:hypothetical protein